MNHGQRCSDVQSSTISEILLSREALTLPCLCALLDEESLEMPPLGARTISKLLLNRSDIDDARTGGECSYQDDAPVSPISESLESLRCLTCTPFRVLEVILFRNVRLEIRPVGSNGGRNENVAVTFFRSCFFGRIANEQRKFSSCADTDTP